MKTGKKVLSLALLITALVLANYIARQWSARLDCTADRLYTLSPGTLRILGRLEEPASFRLYFSRSARDIPVYFKNYASRVEEMLRQYVAARSGLLSLQVVDPKPDSREEEDAINHKLEGQLLPDGTRGYFGLVVTLAEKEKTIPLFLPEREEHLEYDISQLVHAAQQVRKKRMGLMSPIPFRPAQVLLPGQPVNEGQAIAREWARTYEIIDVSSRAAVLPEDLDVLVLVHPHGLSDETLYAIDQYLLHGGALFVALDPSSRYFRNNGLKGDVLGGPALLFSNLPRLLQAWGVSYDPRAVVADLTLAAPVTTAAGDLRFPVWINVARDQVDAGFQPFIGVDSLLLIEPGFFEVKPPDGVEATPLLTSTAKAGTFGNLTLGLARPAELMRSVVPSGVKTMAVLLHGSFPTAFPDGPPRRQGAEAASETPPAGLARSEKPGTIFLVGDADWMMDEFSVRVVNVSGTQVLEPLNDNMAAAVSVMEYLGGSEDLISIRSKGISLRPFKIVEAMEVAAQEQYQAKLDELDAHIGEVRRKVEELMERQKQEGSAVATPEMKAEYERFRAEEVRMRGERRAIRRALRQDIERLKALLVGGGMIVVPGLVGAFGVWFYSRRSRRKS